MLKAHVKIIITQLGRDATFEGEVEYKTAYDIEPGRPVTMAKARSERHWVYHENKHQAMVAALMKSLALRDA